MLDLDLRVTALGTAASWLGTYLLHSTLLLGVVWGASRWLRRRKALSLEETLWKSALLGSLVTATMQLCILGLLAAPGGGLATPASRLWNTPSRDLQPAEPLLRSPASLSETSTVVSLPPAPHPVLASVRGYLPGWRWYLVRTWMAGALLLVLLSAVRWRRFHRRLQNREEVLWGPVRTRLDQLGGEGVRLTVSKGATVPCALGIRRPEVCLPAQAMGRLSAGQLDDLLAHELAHLVRRDPFWLLLRQGAECLFFLQPLVRVAGRRLASLAEHLSDSWATERTGQPVRMARTLTAVAEWLLPRPVHAPVPGLAQRGSELGHRVHRLLEGGSPPPPPRWLPWMVAGALAATLAFVPGLDPVVASTAPSAAEESPPVDAELVPVAPLAASPEEAPAPPAPEAPAAAPQSPAPPALPSELDPLSAFASPEAFDTILRESRRMALAASQMASEILGSAEVQQELRRELQAGSDELRRQAEQLRSENTEQLQEVHRQLAEERHRLSQELRHQHLRAVDLQQLREEALRQAREELERARHQLSAERERLDRQREALEELQRELERSTGESGADPRADHDAPF